MKYPVCKTVMEDEIDRIVSDKREDRRLLEQRQEQEKKMQLEAERIKQEIENRNKEMKKGLRSSQPSYDFHGGLVHVQHLTALPTLAAKCNPMLADSQTLKDSAKRKGQPQPTWRTTTMLRRGQPPEWEQELQRLEVGQKERTARRLAIAPPKIYERFVPAAGVTFSEVGRSPKSRLGLTASFAELAVRTQTASGHLQVPGLVSGLSAAGRARSRTLRTREAGFSRTKVSRAGAGQIHVPGRPRTASQSDSRLGGSTHQHSVDSPDFGNRCDAPSPKRSKAEAPVNDADDG